MSNSVSYPTSMSMLKTHCGHLRNRVSVFMSVTETLNLLLTFLQYILGRERCTQLCYEYRQAILGERLELLNRSIRFTTQFILFNGWKLLSVKLLRRLLKSIELSMIYRERERKTASIPVESVRTERNGDCQKRKKTKENKT